MRIPIDRVRLEAAILRKLGHPRSHRTRLTGGCGAPHAVRSSGPNSKWSMIHWLNEIVAYDTHAGRKQAYINRVRYQLLQFTGCAFVCGPAGVAIAAVDDY